MNEKEAGKLIRCLPDDILAQFLVDLQMAAAAGGDPTKTPLVEAMEKARARLQREMVQHLASIGRQN